MEILVTGYPVSVEPDDPALLDLLCSLRSHGLETALKRAHGGTDARWFTPQGSSILVMGVPGSAFHVDDEYVSVDGLVKFYDVLESLLDELADNF